MSTTPPHSPQGSGILDFVGTIRRYRVTAEKLETLKAYDPSISDIVGPPTLSAGISALIGLATTSDPAWTVLLYLGLILLAVGSISVGLSFKNRKSLGDQIARIQREQFIPTPSDERQENPYHGN